jgi:hypothetical protein
MNMALKPDKNDPNYAAQMEEWKKDNSNWAGDDMNKGMPPKVPSAPAPGHGVAQQPKR